MTDTTPEAEGTPEGTGKVRWKRFAAIMIPAGVVTGGLLFATASGALASSFALSGQSFKISAASIDGTGFEQYGSAVQPAGHSTADTPVAIAGMKTATIHNMCQSVSVGPITMKLTAGGGDTPATASNLVLSMSSLDADKATFGNMNIGQDASTLDGPAKGSAGMFGQQADTVHLEGVKQTVWATTAGTFKLPGLHLGFNFTKDECD